MFPDSGSGTWNGAPIEGALPAGSGGSDRHVLVIDHDNNRLYELAEAYRQTGNSWNAMVGAIFDLDSNNVRPSALPRSAQRRRS